jgi:hypothetical protein
VLLLCAGCAAAPDRPSEETPATSIGGGITGCCVVTTTTTDMVKAAIGEPVAGRWPTGSGTVIVENAYWATEELRQHIEAKWGQPAVDDLLVLDVTYESLSGTIPVSRMNWTIQPVTGSGQGEMGVFGLAGPDNPVPSEYSQRELPDGAQLGAGEVLNGLFAFDVPAVPSVVYLSDASPGHLHRLAQWLIDPASNSATATISTS